MKVKEGIYLIIDPSVDKEILLVKLKEIVGEAIAMLQIWDNFNPDEDPLIVINEVLQLCHKANIPVLINNQWQFLKECGLDGVHFDGVQDHIQEIKHEVGREILIGITCNNDLSVVKWADENEIDYLSFCSMFPSSTSNSCELVSFETVQEAKKMTSIPIFLAGGIKPENMTLLSDLPYSGIAIVSGIMEADKPVEAIKNYTHKIRYQS